MTTSPFNPGRPDVRDRIREREWIADFRISEIQRHRLLPQFRESAWERLRLQERIWRLTHRDPDNN